MLSTTKPTQSEDNKMKIEVGKKYELNNGDIVECTKLCDGGLWMGYGPFVIGGSYYHEDGRHGTASLSARHSVNREYVEGKTLAELNVKAGDVVRWKGNERFYTVSDIVGDKYKSIYGYLAGSNMPHWSIVSRAKPTLWRDMTDAEKGAILLAKHNGRVIEYWWDGKWRDTEGVPQFLDDCRYRARPEPEIVALCYRRDVGNVKNRIGTINLVDGIPDPASIRMDTL